jgi:hypothetical protein
MDSESLTTYEDEIMLAAREAIRNDPGAWAHGDRWRALVQSGTLEGLGALDGITFERTESKPSKSWKRRYPLFEYAGPRTAPEAVMSYVHGRPVALDTFSDMRRLGVVAGHYVFDTKLPYLGHPCPVAERERDDVLAKDPTGRTSAALRGRDVLDSWSYFVSMYGAAHVLGEDAIPLTRNQLPAFLGISENKARMLTPYLLAAGVIERVRVQSVAGNGVAHYRLAPVADW